MKKRPIFAAAAAVALFATAAYAGWTLDAAGNGFVGKGDVQTALGWNNAELQANAANPDNLVFSYEDRVVLAQLCEKDGVREDMTKDFTRVRSISSDVSYDARKVNQVSGFFLTGFSDLSDSAMPADICPNDNDNPAQPKWAPVEGDEGEVRVISATGGGVLKVNGVPLDLSARY
jgi:hypothetical protein